MKLRPLAILFLTFLVLTVFGQKPLHVQGSDSPRYYDEVFDESGKVRPRYENVYHIYSELGKKKKTQIMKSTLRDFGGDNALNPLPRLLTEKEFAEIKTGVEQRAQTLRMFLADHFSGRKNYLKDGIIPKDVITNLLTRHGVQDWEKYVKPEHLQWVYGPDIFRLPNGAFSVVEDNVGFLGGMGDLITAKESLFDKVPAYADVVVSADPEQFYKNLINRYRKRAIPPDGKIVLLRYTSQSTEEVEDTRLANILKKYNAEVVMVPDMEPASRNAVRKLEARKDGVYLINNKNKTSQKVGFVAAYMDYHSIDGSHPAVKKQLLIKELKDLLEGHETKLSPVLRKGFLHYLNEVTTNPKLDVSELEELLLAVSPNKNFIKGNTGVPGLYQAFFDGKVAMNYSPGLSFVEDKEFYIYVDDLIRYYLKEEPKFQGLQTKSFRMFLNSGAAQLDKKLFDSVFDNLDRFVIKGVSGMGGDEVWIGSKIVNQKNAKSEIKKLQKKILSQPWYYIVQDATHLSVMDGYLVDMRLIADVGPKAGDVMTASVPWGRAIPVTGDGKVNISSKGSEITILVIKTDEKGVPIKPPSYCPSRMKKTFH